MSNTITPFINITKFLVLPKLFLTFKNFILLQIVFFSFLLPIFISIRCLNHSSLTWFNGEHNDLIPQNWHFHYVHHQIIIISVIPLCHLIYMFPSPSDPIVETRFKVTIEAGSSWFRFRVSIDETAGLVTWRIRDRDPSGYGKRRKLWKEDYEESSHTKRK